MYQTSDNYKEQVLADGTQHLLRIYIDENKIEDKYILEFSMSAVLTESDEFCFGSTPAITASLKIHKDALPDTYERFYIETGITDEVIPIGYFNVDEISKDDDFTVSFTLIDDMSKFEFNYDGSTLTYPTTLLEVLQDICLKAGVELGSTSFLNFDKQVAVYDSTVTARTFIGYIAEQAGGFAIVGRDGKLYIRTIGQDTDDLELRYFSEYSWGEEFKASRIAYEDGIQDFKTGDETNNTIWIDSDNIYIVEQEQIDNIYNEYKDFNVYSFSGTSIVNPAWDIGDIIIIDGKKVVYQGEIEYKGKFKASIESDIQAKSKEETTTTTVSSETKIRRAQSQIDQIAAEITILLQEIGDYAERFVEIKATLDGISQIVESIEDFTREKTQIENLYLDDVAEGEGYIIKFTIYGNTELFNTNKITICISTEPRGYGNAVYLATEDGEELITEDGQQIIIGEGSYYIDSLKITLDDVLRNLIIDGTEYCDTLEIEQDGTISVVRRIGVNSDGGLYLLDEEQTTVLEDTFLLSSIEDGVYYFIQEINGLEYYAKYITQNDYSDTFLTKIELGTYITQNAEAVRVAWNQISQYLQMEGIDGKATLNIYNENNNILMSLSQDGQTFYNENGTVIGTVGVVRDETQDVLAFEMPINWESIDNSRTMAWGVTDPNGQFLPIFYLSGYYGDENSEYGGVLEVVGEMNAETVKIAKAFSLDQLAAISWDDIDIYIVPVISIQNDTSNYWLTFHAPYGYEFFIGDTSVFSINSDNMYIKKPFFVAYSDSAGYVGYPMIGLNDNNTYQVYWNGSYLFFYVDGTYVDGISDKRLKSDFEEIDDNFLDAIEELEIQQFKCDNRNGLISFGIIAQDLIDVFNKYEINLDDYEIIKKIKYKANDDTEYYAIEYTQFLILKQLAADRKIKEQQDEIDELKAMLEKQQEQINKLLESI